MVCCKAWGCGNTGSEPGIHMHRFPSDQETRKKWVIAINRENFSVNDIRPSTKLCSAHFLPSDYKINHALQNLIDPASRIKNWTLKAQAVPSIFAHKPRKEERKSAALEKRNRHEVGSIMI